jgi:hypothetical protein
MIKTFPDVGNWVMARIIENITNITNITNSTKQNPND